MKVFTAAQMREFDRAATEEYGIPSIVLMENAALRVVEFLEAKFAPLQGKKVVILCGKGNNGGDGLAIARLLQSSRVDVIVYLAASKEDYKGDALINLKANENSLYDFEEDWNLVQFDSSNLRTTDRALESADIVIDALCGTGFSGEVRSETLKKLLGAASIYNSLSVDLPSTLDADSGKKQKGTPYGYHTITFAGPKRGMFVNDGPKLCGEIWVGDIGTFPKQMWETETGVSTLDIGWCRGCVPKNRSIDTHKGDAGRALIIGGSFGMSGAVALASKAALKSGAGLCIAAVPEKVLPIFASSILEATSHPLTCDEKGFLIEKSADELAELWKNVHVVALGPGIGRSEETQKFVARVVKECPKPLVIDADALFALPAIADAVKSREADTVLTPHPGEMGTLMGISAKEVNEKRFETVEACAKKYGAIVVLKGARSLVAVPDGDIFVNLTGNPGMATGGSGDVLTGTIAGLLAQIKHPQDATKLGVYIHGYAGDLAFKTLGNGLVASDIANHLPLALEEVKTREPEQINGRLRKLE